MSPKDAFDSQSDNVKAELVRQWIKDACAKARQHGQPYHEPSDKTVQHIVRVVNGLKRSELGRWDRHEKRLHDEKAAISTLWAVLPALIAEREKDNHRHRINDDPEYVNRLKLYEALVAFEPGEQKKRKRGRPKSASRYWGKALCGPIRSALVEVLGHEPSRRVGGAFVAVMINALKTIGQENVSPSAVSEMITDFLKDSMVV